MVKLFKRHFYHQCYMDAIEQKKAGYPKMELAIRFFKYKRWVNRKIK